MKVIFDVETTGLDCKDDEILQFSAIDETGTVLLSSYVRPTRHSSWPQAEMVNGISPEMVQDAPCFSDIRDDVQKIFNQATELVAYNGAFDIGFLRAVGITFPDVPYYDVMIEFAPIYGEYSECYGGYKWQKLTTCAKYYGYEFKAHDSLEDTRATLYCYKQMVAENKVNGGM